MAATNYEKRMRAAAGTDTPTANTAKLLAEQVLKAVTRHGSPIKRVGVGRPRTGTSKFKYANVRMCDELGLTPLQFLLGVLIDKDATRREKIEAAKAAAPYVHPRLHSVESNHRVTVTHEEALAQLE